MASPINSKDTRVQPIFKWLQLHGGINWPTRFINLASGLDHVPSCGSVCRVILDPELEVPPTALRLAWMIRNANLLVPQDGKNWRAIEKRLADADSVSSALKLLDSGQMRGIPRKLILEGKTHADCLIECEKAIIWVEGKRYDWISPSTKWDISRDQLARNLEAAWSLTSGKKDYYLVICYENELKHHETLLINGYRQGTWNGGWPHITEHQRKEFSKHIGTLKWCDIAAAWPELSSLPELHDLKI